MALLSGCTASLEVPPGTEITCSDTSQCPDGFVCVAQLGQCRRTGSDDSTPPAVSGVAVDPPHVRSGRRVRVSLDVDGPLSAAPRVYFLQGTVEIDLGLETPWNAAATHFVAFYDATGSEPEGEVPVRALMVDEAGNVFSGPLGETIDFDFTAPAVLAGSTTLTLHGDDPIFVPTALAAGVKASVSFIADEPVDVAASPALHSAPVALPWAMVSATGTSFLFNAVVDAASPALDGPLTVTAQLTDLAGNVGTPVLALSGLALQNTPATPPDTASADAVVFVRKPWGDVAGAEPSFTVTVDGPALDPATVELRVFDHASGGIELGRADADLAGTTSIALNTSDRSRVYVRAVNDAGLESVGALVRDGVWVAGFGGKVAADGFSNPHRAVVTQDAASRTLATDPRRTSAADDGAYTKLSQDDAASLTVSGGTYAVALVSPFPSTSSPPSTDQIHGVSDPLRGTLRFFGGGLESNAFTNELFEWSNSAWHSVSADGIAPAASSGVNFVGDLQRDRAVLVARSLFPPDAVLSFLDSDGWRGLTAPIFGDHTIAQVAYDEHTGFVYAFANGTLGLDTYRLEGDAWVLVATGPGPLGRSFAATVYDPRLQGILMYGGEGSSCLACCPGAPTLCDDDLWVLHEEAWQPLTPSTVPPGRRSAQLVYDERANVVLMFGGAQNLVPDEAYDDLWQWDGADWAPLCTSSPCSDVRPPGRRDAAFAYDFDGDAVFLFGGNGGSTITCTPGRLCGDTWRWTGSRWRPVSFTASQTNMVMPFAGVAFDSAQRLLVSRNGADGLFFPSGLRAEYAWNGRQWDDVCDGLCSSGPTKRFEHAMAYDPVRKVSVLFGGRDVNSGTTTYPVDMNELGAGGWTATSPSGPAGRAGLVMSYDGSGVLIFGGRNASVLADTWRWNGAAWDHLCNGDDACNNSPPARSFAAVAYDPDTSTVTMMGGLDNAGAPLGDTWAFHAGNWAQVCTSGCGIPARYGAAMVYDSHRRRLILHGGCSAAVTNAIDCPAASIRSDVWQLNGGVWTQVTAAGADVPRYGHAAFYDAEADATYLVGGALSFQGMAGLAASLIGEELYRLRLDADDAPGLIATFNMGAAGVSSGDVVGLQLGATAGGVSFTTPAGTSVSGAALEAWRAREGRWVRFVENHTVQKSALAATMNTQAGVRGLLLDGRYLNVRLRPVATRGSGTTASQIDADSVAVRLSYRLDLAPACGDGLVSVGEDCELGSPGCAAGCHWLVASEVEPNANLAQAQATSARVIDGTLSAAVDQDWFRIVRSGPGPLVVDLSDGAGSCPFDAVLTLFASDGVTVLGVDDDGGIGTCPRIDARIGSGPPTLDPGTYYLRVGGSVGGATPYRLTILDG